MESACVLHTDDVGSDPTKSGIGYEEAIIIDDPARWDYGCRAVKLHRVSELLQGAESGRKT